MSPVRYVVVTPVRNEADRIKKTIDSMVAQSVTPAAWIIVDDGSGDGTAAIVDAAASRLPWVRGIHRPDRGFRKSGGGVIDAFYDGLAHLSTPNESAHSSPSCSYASPAFDFSTPRLGPSTTPLTRHSGCSWDFLVKLDGDLLFAPDYFAQCFERFAADPKLGIGGGLVCWERNGQWIEEAKGDPPFHVRGATKIYRRACWEALEGLVPAPGWDTLDELKANMLGWRTYTFSEIKLLQLKSTGTADGTWKNWVKNGRANYITGYHPLFMFLKCLKRTAQKPHVVAALGLMAGFLTGYLKRVRQVEDRRLIRYVRRQQINRLLGKQSLWS